MRRPNLSAVLQAPHMIRFRLTLWYTGLAAAVLAAFVASVFVTVSRNQVDTLTHQDLALLYDSYDQQVAINLYSSCPEVRGGLTLNERHQVCAGVAVPRASSAGADAQNSTGNAGPLDIKWVYLNGQPVKSPSGHPLGNQPSGSVLNTKDAKNSVKAATKDRNGASIVTDVKGWHLVTLTLSSPYGPVIGQIAEPLSKVDQQVDFLKHDLIYAAAVLLLISAAGGWLLSGRALKPIDEITRRAQQITVRDLSQRLNMKQDDELGRMAATFDDLIARLEEAFERQKRFTSDASHELRTPLTVMQADLSLALARPRGAEEYRQTLVSMDEEVTRLTAIVNDLLMLTRIDVDPAGMQHQPVALHEMLTGLCKRVRVIAAERGITVDAEPIEPVTIVGDATRLRQLFTNLLDNAVTYTPAGGRVSVAVKRTRDGARVQVADTGIGVAADDLPRIFERFYRASAAREQNVRGTGLGLAISRSVVQAHRGEIAVQSTPGQGTTFTVTLPTDGRKPYRRIYGLRALVPGLVGGSQ